MKKDEIEFTDNFIIGLEEIDNQHKRLFELINTLNKNLTKKNYANSMIIEDLRDYAIFHFSTEEFYMKKLNCPFLNTQIKEHNNFISLVLKQLTKIDQLNENDYKEIHLFLKKWIINHILNEDLKIKDYITQ